MKQPGVDVREALAKLSEMQAAIAAQQAQYNVGLVDAQMQSLGEAMASTQALEAAGKASSRPSTTRPPRSSSRPTPSSTARRPRRSKEKLKQVAQAMGDGRPGPAERGRDRAGRAARGGHRSSSRGASRSSASSPAAHGRRKQINDLLDAPGHEPLGECKGNCKKNSDAPRSGLRKKSNQPDQQLGHGHQRQRRRREDQARREPQARGRSQGQAGDGPSEIETTHSPEGRQAASPRVPRDLPEVPPDVRGRRSTASRSPWAIARRSAATSS